MHQLQVFFDIVANVMASPRWRISRLKTARAGTYRPGNVEDQPLELDLPEY